MSTKNEIISTTSAPAAIGPYSQALKAGNLVFLSGQIPLDPKTQTVEAKTIQDQTQQVCLNLKAVLEAAGTNFSKVVKTTCFLKDLSQFNEFNSVYEKFFGETKPARATIEVARLPKDVLVEIELVATI